MTSPLDPIYLTQTTSGNHAPPAMVRRPDGRLFHVSTDGKRGERHSVAADGTVLTSRFAGGGRALDGVDVDSLRANLLGTVMVNGRRPAPQGDDSGRPFTLTNASQLPERADVPAGLSPLPRLATAPHRPPRQPDLRTFNTAGWAKTKSKPNAQAAASLSQWTKEITA